MNSSLAVTRAFLELSMLWFHNSLSRKVLGVIVGMKNDGNTIGMIIYLQILQCNFETLREFHPSRKPKLYEGEGFKEYTQTEGTNFGREFSRIFNFQFLNKIMLGHAGTEFRHFSCMCAI